MNTLREAVQDYLDLRRSLGFKLHDAAKLLLKFVAFMEQHRAPYITTQLALAWAQQPSTVQAAEWARRLSVVRTFARHRSATDPRTQIPPPGLLPFQPKRHDLTCTPKKRSVACCGPPSGCLIAISAISCDRGFSIVYSDC